MEQAAGPLIVLSAPSGAGKTTLARKLLAAYPNLAFSVSATTRPPRPGEVEGQAYYFMEVARFQSLIHQGELLEWEEVYPGRFYGTPRSEVTRIHKAGQIPVFDVDVQGALSIKRIFGEKAITLFIMPPNRDALLARLHARGADSAEDIERRFAKAEQELAFAEKFDFILLNDNLDRAFLELCELLKQHIPTLDTYPEYIPQ